MILPIKFEKTRRSKGMTLIELLVVLSIFMIVTTLTIFDYGKFRSSASLQNLADDVSLAIRQAQNYAIGVRSGQSASFTKGYGIHFSTANPVLTDARAGSNKTFILFNDLDSSNTYNYPTSSSVICDIRTLVSGDECINMLNIVTSDKIYQICPNGASCAAGYADIRFIRPNPDAYICTGSLGAGCSGPLSSVDIIIKNDQTATTKTITVSKVGQISVK